MVCIFHTEIGCFTEFNVMEMPVSDTEYLEIDERAHTVDTRRSFPPCPRRWEAGYHHVPVLLATKICVLQDITGQQNIKMNFYHPTQHSAINRKFAVMYIIRLCCT